MNLSKRLSRETMAAAIAFRPSDHKRNGLANLMTRSRCFVCCRFALSISAHLVGALTLGIAGIAL